MLTDAAIKALRPKDKIYKVADRDGMYVRVMPSGAISFRLDYRLNGRRETVYLGKYGRDGISLARARELCLDARRAIREGRSPAIEKQREKRRLKACVIGVDKRVAAARYGEQWHRERLQCCIAELRNLDCAWFDRAADTLHQGGDRLKIGG